MRKMILLSFVGMTLLFTGCGEDTKISEVAVKAKEERTVELEKMAADKIIAKATEKAEVAQIRAAEKAAAKVNKAAEEAAKREAKSKAIADEVAKKEAEAKAAAEKALKETNATEEPVTDASIIEAANKETKVKH